MKFVLDENLPFSMVDTIKEFGFDVEHIRVSRLKGAPDDEIVKYAKEQKAILITKDLEFGSLIVYPKGSHYGLIVLRLPHLFKTEQLKSAVRNFLNKINEKELINSLVILELGKYRVR